MKTVCLLIFNVFLLDSCNTNPTATKNNNQNTKVLNENILIVNSSGKFLKGKFVEIKGCKFAISYNHGRIEEISTSDTNFRTKEGIAVGMSFENFKSILNHKIHKIELYNGVDSFYKLESGWVINMNNKLKENNRIAYIFTRDTSLFFSML